MTTVGEVVQGELEFEWRIKSFSSLSDEVHNSPSFCFAGASWYLNIYPGRYMEDQSFGYIDLCLLKESPSPPINMQYSLSLKTADGKKEPENDYSFVFEKERNVFGKKQFLMRAKLLEYGRLHSDTLTVFCAVKILKPSEDAVNIASLRCSFCKLTLEVGEDIYSHQQKCMDKPVRCAECGEVVILKDLSSHECQMARTEASGKLLQDFKAMMLDGDLSDVIVKVKEEEFHLHRNILAVRNPFFYSMFKNDMKEKVTGIVVIDDCEPDIFQSFAHFLYVGKVDKLSSENVCDLYKIADKYQEDQLKKECLHFMYKTLIVDNFCDFFVLALKYNEKKLFQNTIEYFTSKGNEIARSLKWQTFMREYPTQANELLIKTLDHYIK